MTEITAPSLRSRFVRFTQTTIANRLLLALLAISLLPLAVLGGTMYYISSKSLMRHQANELETVCTIKSHQIESYFHTIKNHLLTASESIMIVEAMREMRDAVPRVFEKGLNDKQGKPESKTSQDKAESVTAMRAQLRSFYANEFARAFAEKNNGKQLDIRPLVEPLNDLTVYLQYWYIRKNSNPAGARSLLNRAGDQSLYSQLHAKFHPPIRSFQQRYGFYDIFLVDVDTGQIVYTVMKEVDFGTSLREGPYAMTNLGRLFQQAAAATWKDDVAFVDYESYVPSYGQPASFIASPIFDGQKKIGVVIFQMPIQRIDEIMKSTVGLGQTGESYLVGPDKLFRSNSRFVDELGVKTTIINPKCEVDSEATRTVFDKGLSGTQAIIDYRNTPVLSSWQPVTIFNDGRVGSKDVTWAVVAEVDMEEIHEPIKAIGLVAIIVFGISVVLVLWVSYLFSQRFLREASRQTVLVTGIADNTETIASASEELSSVSETLSANAEQTTAQANVVSSAAEQVSASAQTVASGVDNLSASIREIAESASDVAEMATVAVQSAINANDRINQLGDSSAEIGEVVKVIKQIAEQTNLLALNATIEAARAGEAGKGFAVVANEVKELAHETAKATESIGRRVKVIQDNTQTAVAAIGEISSVIQKISDLQNTIASAVEEQTATTAEISRNVAEAATGSTEIAQNITQVAEAAQGTAEGAGNTLIAASELARMAANLQQLVDQYKHH